MQIRDLFLGTIAANGSLAESLALTSMRPPRVALVPRSPEAGQHRYAESMPQKPFALEPQFGARLLEQAGALYNFARYLSCDAVLEEELVQDAFARALDAQASFVPGSNLKAWLFRIVRNAFLDANDHLRVLYTEHPIEIESGGIHQVKPWFAGWLEFAPLLDFSGADEFPLEGGAIGLFVDRKAATFVFKHRLHTATLFVFRSEGLGWPLRNNASVGALPASSTTSRGFNVLLWRDGDLGYAVVSDVDRSELARLAAKVAKR